MAATNFTPAAGTNRFIRGYGDIKKIDLSVNPRLLRSGAFLWLNKVSGRYQGEPANISITAAGTDMTASTSNQGDTTSLAHAQAAFAALFLGIAAGGRIPQQNNNWGQFGASGNAVNANMDASKPFEGYYDEGIFAMPVGPTLSSTGVLTARVEVGTYVQPDGFENNDGSVGFYDDAGAKHTTESAWYLYDNCVSTTQTIANRIGVVCEPAAIGSQILMVRIVSQVLRTGPLA